MDPDDTAAVYLGAAADIILKQDLEHPRSRCRMIIGLVQSSAPASAGARACTDQSADVTDRRQPAELQGEEIDSRIASQKSGMAIPNIATAMLPYQRATLDSG